MYTNKHLSLHTHYMQQARITTDGRWVGRVGGAHIRTSMHTNTHLSLHTHITCTKHESRRMAGGSAEWAGHLLS